MQCGASKIRTYRAMKNQRNHTIMIISSLQGGNCNAIWCYKESPLQGGEETGHSYNYDYFAHCRAGTAMRYCATKNHPYKAVKKQGILTIMIISPPAGRELQCDIVLQRITLTRR